MTAWPPPAAAPSKMAAACHAAPDARWQLVHATHSMPSEVEGVAGCGAGVVLCPGCTRSQPGRDGLPDPARLAGARRAVGAGPDSQVTRSWPGKSCAGSTTPNARCSSAMYRSDPATSRPRRHVCSTCTGQRRLSGWFRTLGLVDGARADLLVLDDDDDGWPACHPTPARRHWCSPPPARPFARVMVAAVGSRCLMPSARTPPRRRQCWAQRSRRLQATWPRRLTLRRSGVVTRTGRRVCHDKIPDETQTGVEDVPPHGSRVETFRSA